MLDSSNYPLWHGTLPMGPFLRHRLDSDRFLVRGEGVRVRDASGRWFVDARSSCWNMALGYSAGEVKEAVRRQLEPQMGSMGVVPATDDLLDLAACCREAGDRRDLRCGFGDLDAHRELGQGAPIPHGDPAPRRPGPDSRWVQRLQDDGQRGDLRADHEPPLRTVRPRLARPLRHQGVACPGGPR